MGYCRDCYHAEKCEAFGPDTYCEDDRFEDARQIAKLKENAAKYRWHDLRKNPDDLPEDYEYVITCYFH